MVFLSLTNRRGNNLREQYFFLNREWIFVKGKDTSAIYNLFNGDIVTLDKQRTNIIMLSESGSTIYEIAKTLSTSEGEVKEVLKSMLSMGKFYDRKVYIEKYKKKSLLDLNDFIRNPPVISKVFLELPGSCEMNCSFCNLPKNFPCLICSKNLDNFDFVGENTLKSFLSRLLKLDCKNLIFHGEDPIASKETLFSIIDFCRRQGYKGKILVIINGIHIDNEITKLLNRYQVSLLIPLFHFHSEGYFITTGSNKVFEKIKHSLDFIHQKSIPFALNIIVNDCNVNNIEEMENFARSFEPENIFTTLILYNNEIQSPKVSEIVKREMLIRITPDTFYNNVYHHPCLHGTLAVSVEGNLLPCPFLKDEILGNIGEDRIIDRIFETREIDRYWDMSLSNFAKCNECEFRFGCIDCYAAEQRSLKEHKRNIICPHNMGGDLNE